MYTSVITRPTDLFSGAQVTAIWKKKKERAAGDDEDDDEGPHMHITEVQPKGNEEDDGRN